MKKILKGGDKEIAKVMTDFYTLVCNASHPNYDAHDMTGYFDHKKGRWIGLSADDFKKRMVNDALWYTPPVTMTISMIEYICRITSEHERVNNFNILSSPKYLE